MPSTSSAPHGPPEFGQTPRTSGISEAIALLLQGGTLSAAQSAAAFESMMADTSGAGAAAAHHGEIGALLALLALRTPTSDELLGAARVMRQHVDRVESSCDPADIVDTAGTGGAPKTFNVSTAAAIIAAAAGAKVAKHGNRSRTGRGSAQVLQKLGVNVDASRHTQAHCLDEAGVCFCFAIHHHPATRHAMPVRQALKFPTIFNLLGPLTNPAGARRQLMGVYAPQFLRPIAEALRDLGAIRAMVVHSEDGLDELSIVAEARTRVMQVEHGMVREDLIDPRELGLSGAKSLEEVQARDLDHAARMILDVLQGRERGPVRDMAVLNAAAAILVAGKAPAMPQALQAATHAIDSGAAQDTLERLIALSNAPS